MPEAPPDVEASGDYVISSLAHLLALMEANPAFPRDRGGAIPADDPRAPLADSPRYRVLERKRRNVVTQSSADVQTTATVAATPSKLGRGGDAAKSDCSCHWALGTGSWPLSLGALSLMEGGSRLSD